MKCEWRRGHFTFTKLSISDALQVYRHLSVSPRYCFCTILFKIYVNNTYSIFSYLKIKVSLKTGFKFLRWTLVWYFRFLSGSRYTLTYGSLLPVTSLTGRSRDSKTLTTKPSTSRSYRSAKCSLPQYSISGPPPELSVEDWRTRSFL